MDLRVTIKSDMFTFINTCRQQIPCICLYRLKSKDVMFVSILMFNAFTVIIELVNEWRWVEVNTRITTNKLSTILYFPSLLFGSAFSLPGTLGTSGPSVCDGHINCGLGGVRVGNNVAALVPRWCHQMEAFSALLALCAGNSPVTGEFPAQRPVTRSFDFSLICAWINGWVNNHEAGDLRRHLSHYDVTVMRYIHVKL